MNYAEYKAKGNNINPSLLAPAGAHGKRTRSDSPAYEFNEKSLQMRDKALSTVKLSDLKMTKIGLVKRQRTPGGLAR